jgi:hypothetical protein
MRAIGSSVLMPNGGLHPSQAVGGSPLGRVTTLGTSRRQAFAGGDPAWNGARLLVDGYATRSHMDSANSAFRRLTRLLPLHYLW